jgi:signal transduction histidine kinase
MLRRKSEQLTLSGFVFSLIVMAALSVLSLHQARMFADSAGRLAHGQEILRSLELLRGTVSGAESSHRSHLITGSTAYGDDYKQALNAADSQLQGIARLVAGNTQQSMLFSELSAQISARIATFEQVLATYRMSGFAAARILIGDDTGRQQTERIGQIIDAIGKAEQQSLRIHERQQNIAKMRLQYSIMTLAIVLLLVLSLIYIQVRRSAATARQAEHLLNRLNVTLETRVTERTVELEARTRELEQQALQLKEKTRQLEEKSAQLESFSYSVSHDLRAPLRAISGFAQILARRHRSELSGQGQHFLDNIVQASSHMGRLIDDLLNYSRLGRRELVFKPISLHHVFSDIAGFLQPRIAESGAAISFTDSMPAVTGDRTLLSQIFTNLLENALTYRRPGSAAKISVTCEDAADKVIVSVADNGIGIAAEHYDRIFNVFQRLHNQEEFPGTGIGLAVVKKAVDMLGGRVWVESTPGVGSTFHVQLQKST